MLSDEGSNRSLAQAYIEAYNGVNRRIPGNRPIGHIIECDGERAIIVSSICATSTVAENRNPISEQPDLIAEQPNSIAEQHWAVGRLIAIHVGENRVIGLVYKTIVANHHWHTDQDNAIQVHVELLGEVRPLGDGNLSFNTGLTRYPHMGAVAHNIRSTDLAAVYARGNRRSVEIGTLTQDAKLGAHIAIDDLLSRHFAIVGTTGVGKSSAVTLLMRKIVAERPDLRILILDPHNEFASAFPDIAVAIDHKTLDLPFWMFRLEEFADVVFRGRTPDPVELDALNELVQQARENYRRVETGVPSSLRRQNLDQNSISADTPVPYRLADLIALIDERMGLLDSKAERPYLRSLKSRLESIAADPRFRFMFASASSPDTMAQTIARIFRIPADNRPICAFQLAGLPSEVVNAVASVLCRLAFDIAVSSDGRLQTLVVCEEAHRYIPADINAGFWPTRQAISRIAKEGRKYGVYLGVISQRPAELDPTILSQCNTIFAMRLGNEQDQTIIKGAMRGAARSMAGFLSSIANREAIAFGEALATPMRMTFASLPAHQIPGSQEEEEAIKHGKHEAHDQCISLASIVERLRHFHGATAPETNVSAHLWGSPVEQQRPNQPEAGSTYRPEPIR